MKNVIAWVKEYMSMSLESIRLLEAEGTIPQQFGYGELRYTEYKVTVMGYPVPGSVRGVSSLESFSIGQACTKVILVKAFSSSSHEYIALLAAINKDNLS